MAGRNKATGSPPTGQAKRAKLSAEESLKRMEEFPERKEQFVAAVRKGENRSVPVLPTPEFQDLLARDVVVTDDALTVALTDGRTLSVPLTWYPRLWHGTSEERGSWRLIGDGQGIHWPDLDEDISVEGLLEGRRSSEGRRSLKRWLDQRPDTMGRPEPGDGSGPPPQAG